MKNLLTSLRASNETYNSMKHSARAIIRRAEIPLLAVIVLYKAATNLLFVPLMQQLWSLTLRFAPMHYLSNNNASDIFSSPAIILCITLIAILTAFWALYVVFRPAAWAGSCPQGRNDPPACPAAHLSCRYPPRIPAAELARSGLQCRADPVHQFFPRL